MRKGINLVLVAAVGILGALALADALRPDSASSPTAAPARSTRAKPPTLLDTLRREPITGFVVYSDQDCRLHSLRLPRMVDDVIRDEGGADVLYCRFNTFGGRIVGDDVVVSADGSQAARCRGNRVELLDAEGHWTAWPLDGCPLALRPDGGVTQVRRGSIVYGGQVLLSRAELHDAARAHRVWRKPCKAAHIAST